jgi:hypothetical protein
MAPLRNGKPSKRPEGNGRRGRVWDAPPVHRTQIRDLTTKQILGELRLINLQQAGEPHGGFDRETRAFLHFRQQALLDGLAARQGTLFD